MSIELDGWVRKLSPRELKVEEQKNKKKKVESLPIEPQLVKHELPQHCPACNAFTGGSDTCPNCDKIIPPLETN